jgi:hypothetical protein
VFYVNSVASVGLENDETFRQGLREHRNHHFQPISHLGISLKNRFFTLKHCDNSLVKIDEFGVAFDLLRVRNGQGVEQIIEYDGDQKQEQQEKNRVCDSFRVYL